MQGECNNTTILHEFDKHSLLEMLANTNKAILTPHDITLTSETWVQMWLFFHHSQWLEGLFLPFISRVEARREFIIVIDPALDDHTLTSGCIRYVNIRIFCLCEGIADSYFKEHFFGSIVHDVLYAISSCNLSNFTS
jgi:hypothetical protein